MASDNKTIRELLEPYISSKIPRTLTNIFWNMFHGIETGLRYLDSYVKIQTRERRITTAQEVGSLRHIAATNGFEPQLKVPASGKLLLSATGKLFAKAGNTIYIPPYCEFTDKLTNIVYYYDGANIVKLSNTSVIIPVKQGIVETKQHTSLGRKLETVLIDSENIAEGSLTVFDTNTLQQFTQIQSFLDNVNYNDNKQFVLKHSSKPKSPIILYIKGTTANQQLTISYRNTHGALGNISGSATFDSSGLLNYRGEQIDFSDDDLVISNYEGFKLGSDGSDINMLRSSVGFNHGIRLLFDVASYKQYCSAYSTLYIQKVYVDDNLKSLKHIFVGRKAIFTGPSEINKNAYNNCVTSKQYWLADSEFNQLTQTLSDNEFALSSHELHKSEITRYALQITFATNDDRLKHQSELELAIYEQFAKFLYDNGHTLNVDTFMFDFMESKGIKFEFLIFSDFNNANTSSLTYITAVDRLPLLQGNFNIYDKNNVPVQLYDNIIFLINPKNQ